LRNFFPYIVMALSLAGCSTDPSLGNGGGNVASGSAAGSTTTNANAQLQHCSAPMGTIEIDENEGAPWYAYLAQYQLPSTVPLLRLIVQQSDCFVVVDRDEGLANELNEQQLSQSGELRATSNEQGGQMVAADYTMSPSINFSQQGASSIGGLVGFVPVVGGLLGAAAGSLSMNQASTTLLLIDNRSTAQIAAAQGSAKNFDIAGIGGLVGMYGGGALGAYSSTPEGKLVTAAFMDSYNQMVDSLRNYRQQTIQGGLGNGGTLGVQGGLPPQ
jgi:curli biogenesis system outer membrane secretion channel CsgG